MTNEPTVVETHDSNPYGPLTPTDLLQRTFSIYRDQPAIVFGLILIYAMAQLIITGVMASSRWVFHPNVNAGENILLFFLFLCILVLGVGLVYLLTQVVQAAFFYVVTAQAERRAITVGEACSSALEKIVSLMGVSLQIFFRLLGWEILIGAVLGSIALIAALAAGAAELVHASTMAQRLHAAIILLPIGLLFLTLFLGTMFWVVTRYAVAVPACLAENLSAGPAVRRSISLSAKSRGRIYALYLFAFVLAVTSLILQIPLLILAVHAENSEHLLFQAVASAINLAWTAGIISFLGIATSLAYYDLRVRKDGFGAAPVTMNPDPSMEPMGSPASIPTLGPYGPGDAAPEYEI